MLDYIPVGALGRSREAPPPPPGTSSRRSAIPIHPLPPLGLEVLEAQGVEAVVGAMRTPPSQGSRSRVLDQHVSI